MKRALGLIGLALVACAADAAEPLGPLFYTPAQRAQLDALRSRKNVAPAAPEPELPAAPPEVVSYDGIVRRSDGRTTVWINSRAVDDGKPAGDLPLAGRVRPDHRIRLTLPQGGKEIELKVGQTVDVVSGSIVEPYARAPYASVPVKPAAGVPATPARDAPQPARPATGEEDEEQARR